jgi:hypothetical protein
MSKNNLPYNFFYNKPMAKPALVPPDVLVKRGPCKWCGLKEFMAPRNAVYCSQVCKALGHQKSSLRSQENLKVRRRQVKAPPAPIDPEAGLSFLERRVRQMEREGKEVM